MLLQLSKTVKQSPKSPQIFENNGAFCADRPFSKNRSETNCQKSFVFNQLVSELQSYILSTTTETILGWKMMIHFCASIVHPFNNNWNIPYSRKRWWRNSASIVHPFNNNWNTKLPVLFGNPAALQSYILSTTTETLSVIRCLWLCSTASIVHPFNNNWNH